MRGHAGARVQYSAKIVFERKKIDDVLGGQGAWDNVDATEGTRSCTAPRLEREEDGKGEGRELSAPGGHG